MTRKDQYAKCQQTFQDLRARSDSSEFCFADLSLDCQRDLAILRAGWIGFGSVHRGCWFDDWNPKAQADVDSFFKCASVSTMPNSIFLTGKPGRGKTGYLAAGFKYKFMAVARTYTGGYMPGVMHLAPCEKPLMMTDYSFTKDIRSGGELLALAKTAKLLIWDDFLAAYDDQKGFSLAQREEVIFEREQNRLATWISSNISGGDLKEHAGLERTYSRLRESDWMTPVFVGGEDRRKK